MLMYFRLRWSIRFGLASETTLITNAVAVAVSMTKLWHHLTHYLAASSANLDSRASFCTSCGKNCHPIRRIAMTKGRKCLIVTCTAAIGAGICSHAIFKAGRCNLRADIIVVYCSHRACVSCVTS